MADGRMICEMQIDPIQAVEHHLADAMLNRHMPADRKDAANLTFTGSRRIKTTMPWPYDSDDEPKRRAWRKSRY